MLDNGLFTKEELKGMDFSDLIIKLSVLWDEQREKAVQAEILMDSCERIEEQMKKIIEIMIEKDPEGYKQYLETFGKEDENAENLDSK